MQRESRQGQGQRRLGRCERVDAAVAEHVVGYIGRAVPGSLTSAAVWSISKSVIETGLDNDTSQTWADGDADADNIWDDRLTLSYS